MDSFQPLRIIHYVAPTLGAPGSGERQRRLGDVVVAAVLVARRHRRHLRCQPEAGTRAQLRRQREIDLKVRELAGLEGILSSEGSSKIR